MKAGQIMLNGEIYHDTDIASMMQEPGSGNHDVQCSGCLFSQDEKRSMSIMPKIEQSLSNISGDHSSSRILEFMRS